jgi:hypothetical protein
MNKYLIVFLSALLLELGSTMYISAVADKAVGAVMFWAFMGPFIALPFAGLIADEKKWSGRIRIAFSSAIGYLVGAAISMSLIL